ncbi:hypothetical protein OG223_40200 [Streptomyces sp. NBC_01478]|uniref:YxD-tail cyclophane-containing RiPP peptide n=1 Tax=Streptomyces sp. NBC_01478 TaxID=2903882 RepID=UPI002E36E5F6|nr:YxD-tail cyclophane-containing RiPP peptide [Streptomyces sp. NBC_01478]
MADLARCDLEGCGVADCGVVSPARHIVEERRTADPVRTESCGVAGPRRHGAEEHRMVDPAEQQAVQYGPGGSNGAPDGDLGPLPDYTGIDLTALRARVDHPVLGAALVTLLARSCHADGGPVAYHEDSPDTPPDDDRGLLPDYTGIDLTALRARVDHPVLGAVLATLLARSRHADGGLVAYHEDSPGDER